jgi:hypothetical protein
MTKQAPYAIAILSLQLAAGCLSSDLIDTREATLDADGLESLDIDVGPGTLEVQGDPDAEEITVTVEMYSWRAGEGTHDRAEDKLFFRLDSSGDTGRLEVDVANTPIGYQANVYVTVPAHLDLDIDDGSGDLHVDDVDGRLGLSDSSGDIELSGIGGDIEIHDGSGPIHVEDARADVYISDGSGDLTVNGAAGTVTVTDGSGDIHITNAGDVELLGDGSGDVYVD